MSAHRPKLPKLGESARYYVDNTLRVRLRSPGLERYRPRRSRTHFIVVVATLSALVGVIWWLGFLF